MRKATGCTRKPSSLSHGSLITWVNGVCSSHITAQPITKTYSRHPSILPGGVTSPFLKRPMGFADPSLVKAEILVSLGRSAMSLEHTSTTDLKDEQIEQTIRADITEDKQAPDLTLKS